MFKRKLRARATNVQGFVDDTTLVKNGIPRKPNAKTLLVAARCSGPSKHVPRVPRVPRVSRIPCVLRVPRVPRAHRSRPSRPPATGRARARLPLVATHTHIRELIIVYIKEPGKLREAMKKAMKRRKAAAAPAMKAMKAMKK